NAQQVVAMRPTLGEALAAAFGQSFNTGTASGGTGTGTGGTAGTGGQPGTGTGGALNAQARALIAQASTQFDAAQKALQAGDFAGYGRQIKALQTTLRDLQALR
ncbi:MAG TPA: hypothetical protein VIK32_00595, partial [Candidatus Limnocylindrales bacterium]